MTSSQCFLPPKVGATGDLISRNSLSPKILEHATAFFLTPLFFAFLKAQSSQCLNIPIRWWPIAPVAWVITSKGWPSSTCKTIMSFSSGLVIDSPLELYMGQLHVGIQIQLHDHCRFWFGVLMQCCHMLNVLQCSFCIHSKIYSLVRVFKLVKKRFTPALFNILWAILVHVIFHCHWLDVPLYVVFPFLADILPKLPCTNSLILVTS